MPSAWRHRPNTSVPHSPPVRTGIGAMPDQGAPPHPGAGAPTARDCPAEAHFRATDVNASRVFASLPSVSPATSRTVSPETLSMRWSTRPVIPTIGRSAETRPALQTRFHSGAPLLAAGLSAQPSHAHHIR